MAGEGEEDEAAAIELQLEQHLQEQRSSLGAVNEALAADASNADLLEVRTYASVYHLGAVLESVPRSQIAGVVLGSWLTSLGIGDFRGHP
jgi:hypothetical protein